MCVKYHCSCEIDESPGQQERVNVSLSLGILRCTGLKVTKKDFLVCTGLKESFPQMYRVKGDISSDTGLKRRDFYDEILPLSHKVCWVSRWNKPTYLKWKNHCYGIDDNFTVKGINIQP